MLIYPLSRGSSTVVAANGHVTASLIQKKHSCDLIVTEMVKSSGNMASLSSANMPQPVFFTKCKFAPYMEHVQEETSDRGGPL